MRAYSNVEFWLFSVSEANFKEAIPLRENLEVYICLRLDTTVVHNSR
jgi:hypothetical protein